MPADLNLDRATPEDIPRVLRKTADLFYESESELSSAWQDPNAGRIWREYAKILEAAADKCQKALQKYT